MKPSSVALMIYGEPGSSKSVFTEVKYKKLAGYLVERRFTADSVLYHDTIAEKPEKDLLKYNVILVWVNPIEQGRGRTVLDALLRNLSLQGVYVSSHPDMILKMGTNEVLYEVRETEFGGDVKLYRSFIEFKERFPAENSGIRIMKQYRGNGSNSVFKVDAGEIKKQQDKSYSCHNWR